MFLLWITCIFQVIILIKSENEISSETATTTTSVPDTTMDLKSKYKESMQQVNTILTDIEQKIKRERQILQELQNNPAMSADNTSKWLSTVSENIGSLLPPRIQQKFLKSRHAFEDLNVEQFIGAGEIGSESFRKQIGQKDNYFEQNKQNARVSNSPQEDVSALVDDWRGDVDVYVEADTAQELMSRKRSNGPNKIPLLSKLNILMAEQGVGYSYAAIVGFSDVILDKDVDDLKTLIDTFSKSIVRMSDEGKLNSLGDLFANRVKLLRIWSTMSSVASVREIALRTREVLGEKHWDDPLVKILSQYDTLFTSDEGQNLLEKLVAVHEVNIVSADNSMLSFMMDNVIEAFIAPADRLHDTNKLKSLIDMTNKFYLERFPDFRRSEIDTLVNTIDEFESTKTPANRRRISSDVKFGWRKLLRHLIVKHPKLLRKFIDHFKHSRKHHTRSNHHKSSNSKHKHNKKGHTTQDKQYKRKIETAKEINITSPTSAHNKLNQESSNQNISNTPVWLKINPSGFRRIFNDTTETRKASSIPKNKLLQKMLADSDYSDDESELKTNLADAFFSWNGTVGINRLL